MKSRIPVSLPPFPEGGTYDAVQDYLFSLKSSGVHFGVERMRRLADLLGSPEKAVPCIHVAGTNGKGSVSAMLEAVLRAGGLRTGLYSSPHLVRLGERIQVDRKVLDAASISRLARELAPLAASMALEAEDFHPTFFEFMTAMAFLHFARSHCDISVLETGLGGELDATNIVDPELAVITSVGLDHCDMLGGTLLDIAHAKAGIIKPGRPVVIGRLPAEAEALVRRRAGALDAPLFSVRERFGEEIDSYPRTALEGVYQRWNAATAQLALEVLPARFQPSPEALHFGFSNVSWAGRWQHLELSGRHVVLDSSHNPEGASVLEHNLSSLVEAEGRAPLVFTGVLGAQRAAPLLQVISKYARCIHLAMPRQARACGFEELEALIPKQFSGDLMRSSVEAAFPGPGLCTLGDVGDTVVVTGSIYLIGEVLSRLEPERGEAESTLQDF